MKSFVLAAAMAVLTFAGGAQAAQGLNGQYFNALASYDNAGNEAYAAANTAYATFTANDICFPSCSFQNSIGDGSSLSAFLGVAGGHASNLSRELPYDYVGGHIVLLNGFLNIATAGTYNFRISSDDGSAIKIDGLTVIDNDGLHGPDDLSGSTFLSAGSHAIYILQWENGGGTNLQVQMNGAALGGDLLSTIGPGAPGAVPEPATWALMIGGFGGVGAMLRRRRRTAALAA